MKKTVALAISVILVLISLSCIAQAEEGPEFVTISEWLNARGECGDCMLVLKIRQVLNPVVALAVDETGEVNLEGCILVIANPKYNPYEGTIEMAQWTPLRIIPKFD